MSHYLYPDNNQMFNSDQKYPVNVDEISHNIRLQSRISSVSEVSVMNIIRSLILIAISNLILASVTKALGLFFVQMLDFRFWSIVQFASLTIFIGMPGLLITYIGLRASLMLIFEPRNFNISRETNKFLTYHQVMEGIVKHIKIGSRRVVYFKFYFDQRAIDGKYFTESKENLESGDTINVIFDGRYYAIL